MERTSSSNVLRTCDAPVVSARDRSQRRRSVCHACAICAAGWGSTREGKREGGREGAHGEGKREGGSEGAHGEVKEGGREGAQWRIAAQRSGARTRPSTALMKLRFSSGLSLDSTTFRCHSRRSAFFTTAEPLVAVSTSEQLGGTVEGSQRRPETSPLVSLIWSTPSISITTGPIAHARSSQSGSSSNVSLGSSGTSPSRRKARWSSERRRCASRTWSIELDEQPTKWQNTNCARAANRSSLSGADERVGAGGAPWGRVGGRERGVE